MSVAEVRAEPALALVAEPAVLLQPAPESRPPAQQWTHDSQLGEADPAQPSLLDALRELQDDSSGTPNPRGVVLRPSTGPGSVPAAAGLPDPTAWAALLGLALGEALVGARPTGQLESWVDQPVLADVRCAVRQRARNRRGPTPAMPVVSVFSVRTQCPTPTAVEATIHLRVGAGSLALGLRLQAYGRRWLCTALTPVDLIGIENLSGPRPVRGTA